METLLFVVFIAVFGLIIFLPMNRNRKQNLKRKIHNRPVQQTKSDLLTTPSDTVMAHRREVWAKRQKRVNRTGVEEHQDFVPKFEKSETPEYDGYSRRGRHHLTPSASLKKDAAPEEEFTMTAVKFEPDKDSNLAAANKS